MRICVVNPFAGTEFHGRENLERIKRPDTEFEMVNISDAYPLKNNQFLPSVGLDSSSFHPRAILRH